MWQVSKKEPGYVEISTEFSHLVSHFISTYFSESELEDYNLIIVVRDAREKESLLVCAMMDVNLFVEYLPVLDVVGYFVKFPSSVMTEEVIKALPIKPAKGNPEPFLRRLSTIMTPEALRKHAKSNRFLYNLFP